jgi:hypothetical protein
LGTYVRHTSHSGREIDVAQDEPWWVSALVTGCINPNSNSCHPRNYRAMAMISFIIVIFFNTLHNPLIGWKSNLESYK